MAFGAMRFESDAVVALGFPRQRDYSLLSRGLKVFTTGGQYVVHTLPPKHQDLIFVWHFPFAYAFFFEKARPLRCRLTLNFLGFTINIITFSKRIFHLKCDHYSNTAITIHIQKPSVCYANKCKIRTPRAFSMFIWKVLKLVFGEKITPKRIVLK